MLKNLCLLVFLFSSVALAQPSIKPITFKEIPAQKILIVEYSGKGHIAPYFGKLVAYYNRENISFQIIFPQMSIEFSRNNQWVAIVFEGKAEETKEVKVKTLPKVKVASVIHKGSYQSLSQTISSLYPALYKQKKFPDDSQPMRLLCLNSPDDHYPQDLITEIQIPIKSE